MASLTPTPTSMAKRWRHHAGPHAFASRKSRRTNMTSERQAYIYVQLPGTLNSVPAALLKVENAPRKSHPAVFRPSVAPRERSSAYRAVARRYTLGAQKSYSFFDFCDLRTRVGRRDASSVLPWTSASG